MARYAIIENGSVTGVAEWDGVTAWTPPSGVPVACDETVATDWTYDGSQFIAPPLPPEPDPET